MSRKIWKRMEIYGVRFGWVWENIRVIYVWNDCIEEGGFEVGLLGLEFSFVICLYGNFR